LTSRSAWVPLPAPGGPMNTIRMIANPVLERLKVTLPTIKDSGPAVQRAPHG
jgi:hypothetical protein